MKYTAQLVCTGYSYPEGTSVAHFRSLKCIREWIELNKREAERCGCAWPTEDMPQGVQAIVWIGNLDDVTDIYPEFTLSPGPRGGMIRSPC